jgi:8-hydroxy-5-deazaflavin:NADPH oxidoreductase
MKTAIIGLGTLGSRVANNLVAGGESVILAARDPAKAQALAKKLGSQAEATSIEDAVKTADVLILGIWFETIKEFVAANRASLVGKTIVDPSNPIALDGKGGFKKIIPADQSSGQIIAGLLPEGAELVKAFCSISVQSLEAAANRKPETRRSFLCDGLSERRRGGRKIDSGEWFRARQRRPHRPIRPYRSIRRS